MLGKTVKMKTSKLTGAALDWAVARCEGVDYLSAHKDGFAVEYLSYSTDWLLGGAIIEREKLHVWFSEESVDEEGNLLGISEWYSEPSFTSDRDEETYRCTTGPTPLVAAMRVYVESKLGDDIEIPEDLE